MKEAEDRPVGTDRPPTAAAHRPVTRRQYRYVRWLCSEHELRAESVSRQVMGLDLDHLDRAGASELIDYLEAYGESAEAAARGREIGRQFGLSLLRVESRDSGLVTPELFALGLLAANRVATAAQLTHYVHGEEGRREPGRLKEARALLGGLLADGLVGREIGVPLPALGAGESAEVFYLTERGCDRQHEVSPRLTFRARPGMPPPVRRQHEIYVTEGRLHAQRSDLEDYRSESAIRSEQEQRRQSILREGRGDSQQGGCGDFIAWEVRYWELSPTRLDRNSCYSMVAGKLAVRVYCGRPTRRVSSAKRGSGRRGSKVGSALRKTRIKSRPA